MPCRDTPNGKKISIVLEEMGLAHTLKPINIGSNVDQFTDGAQIQKRLSEPFLSYFYLKNDQITKTGSGQTQENAANQRASFPADFKSVSPNSKIPAIVDYDTADGEPQVSKRAF